MSDTAIRLGVKIRMLRKGKRISQEQLAFRSDLHPTYIGQIERGEKNATLESLNKIAMGLDISLEQLITGKTHDIESTKYQDMRDFNIIFQELPLEKQRVIYNIVLDIMELLS